MLNQTTVTAFRFLTYLALLKSDAPVPPRQIAEQLGLSPTYTAKIAGVLAKANILRSFRGALGGVTLARPANSIPLREIVEACQGVILGDFCGRTDDLTGVCAFHRIVAELHETTLAILSRWTLGDLSEQPCRVGGSTDGVQCRMAIPAPKNIPKELQS